MERLVDEFLSFVRGDAMEEAVMTDPADLLHSAAADGVRAGRAVTILRLDPSPPVYLRPLAITRALDNLIGNAVRYGSRAEISLHVTAESVRFVVDDDGPGIPMSDRAQAAEPFARLDAARNPNQGGGVGLGLAIATDIARSHGGALTLSVAPELGGLRAELRIAR
jgi:two-component system osmolarity sensor histidine kinase EnvZ